MRTMVLTAALTVGGVVMASVQDTRDSTAVDIAQYREMLVGSNPVELWGTAGEELWRKSADLGQISLEACDLGLDLGVVKGTCAKLPHFFRNTSCVMDAE